MDEYLLMINVLMISLISVIIVIYIKKVWKIGVEYVKAKSIIEEIVLSFNKEIKDLKQKIEEIDIKFQKNQAPDVNHIKSELDNVFVKTEKLRDLYSTLEKKINDMSVIVEKLSEKPSQRETGFRDETEPNLPVRAAFHLKRERALAPLTPTELRVLEILSTEGDKTVREIRSKIGLTREHTGRLMKSLYDRGYVERKTNKIPYVYSIKKEMENMLSNKSS